MSKKTRRPPKNAPEPAIAEAIPAPAAPAFGYEEMLTELEAIVSDAEVRNAEDAQQQ